MIEQEEKSIVKNSVMYFILPILQLNKSSFGVGNFINSYVDENGYIIVDVTTQTSVNGTYMYNHPQYITDYDIDGGIRVVYAIPDEYLNDIKLFKEGIYSQFSPALKVLISKYSNLGHNDLIIKALNPQIVDRQKIADELGVKLDLVKELLSAPKDKNFIKIK